VAAAAGRNCRAELYSARERPASVFMTWQGLQEIGSYSLPREIMLRNFTGPVRLMTDSRKKSPVPKWTKSVILKPFRGSSKKYEIEDFCFFGIGSQQSPVREQSAERMAQKYI